MICGKGFFPKKFKKYLNNKNVQFLGYISNDKLHKISSNCSAFINPRLTSNKDWLNNFPSKVLGYLTYNSPTFSTLTENLHPDLYELIIPYKLVDDILVALLNEKLILEHVNLLKSKRSLFTWEKAVTKILEEVSLI